MQQFVDTLGEIMPLLPPRQPSGSKYDHGVVTIVAGSVGMTGALTLASQSALRSGCGMVYALFPHSLLLPLSVKLTEPVLIPSPQTGGGGLALATLEKVKKLSKKTDVLLVGMGVGREEETMDLVRSLVVSSAVPVVLDADGLHAFVGRVDLFKEAKNLVITPHYGEWKKLFGPLSDHLAQRTEALSQVAVKYGITIYLKGVPNIVVTPNGDITVLPVGTSGMATAGSGDVLAGIVASLIAQGASVEHGTVAGVAIHGKAGERAAQKLSDYSMIASDIIDSLGDIFFQLTL